MSAPSLTILLFIALVGLIVLVAAVTLAVLIATRRRPAPDDAGASPVAPPDRYAAIGSLHRDRQSGELLLERQGRLYRSADQLTGDGRKELEMAARELQAWLNPDPPPAHANPSVEHPAAPPPVVPVAPVAPVAPVVEPGQAHRPAAASMVAQIDEILQEMLAASEHANRSIHLSERPECGVLVWIGAQRFEGIDAVPDEAVKALLRAAVQEWERRQIV